MTTAAYLRDAIIPTALSLLPAPMESFAARAMLLAIAGQESGYRYRRQVGGPARGWWQFEAGGGVVGVLEHPASRGAAGEVLATLGYAGATAAQIHAALEHNDVLAAVFARLLLWTDPRPLPQSVLSGVDGWAIYLATWRPGKPRPQTWAGYYAASWPGAVRA